jgi:hypothetical protein
LSSFISTNATQDVFELVLARPVVTHAGEHPRLVHLWWRAPLQGNRLVQIYIDDVLYDVTFDPVVRNMYLMLDRSRTRRIELLAVPLGDPEAVWRPQPGLLKSWQPPVSSNAQLTLIRDETMPQDTQLVVSLDGKFVAHGPMWPTTEPRSGSLTQDGVVYNDACGLGLGIGDLGSGPLGYDGTAWRWGRNDLDPGYHDVRITSIDQSGFPVSVPLDVSVLIEQLPGPVTGFTISQPFGLSWSPATESPASSS